MSTVAEIENALQTIPLSDARKVADWLQHYLDEKWDRQIDAAGKLDKLGDQALEDYRTGRVRPFAGMENELAAMAKDPQIQRELRAINTEFAATESDGLGKL